MIETAGSRRLRATRTEHGGTVVRRRRTPTPPMHVHPRPYVCTNWCRHRTVRCAARCCCAGACFAVTCPRRLSRAPPPARGGPDCHCAWCAARTRRSQFFYNQQHTAHARANVRCAVPATHDGPARRSRGAAASRGGSAGRGPQLSLRLWLRRTRHTGEAGSRGQRAVCSILHTDRVVVTRPN